MSTFAIEYDEDYGAAHRSGWSLQIDGVNEVVLSSLIAAVTRMPDEYADQLLAALTARAERNRRIDERLAEKNAADPPTTWGEHGELSDYDDGMKRMLEVIAEVDAEMGYPAQLESLKRFGFYPHKMMTPEQVRAKWERKP